MRLGKKKLVEFLATWIVKVSMTTKYNILEAEANNIQGSSVYHFFFFLALEPCYTEDDIQYKIENIDGLTNLNAADADKKKASMEECMTYCRHFYT